MIYSNEVTQLLPYTEGFDLSMEKRIELVQTVYSIMESHVDMAWGLNSVQLSRGYIESFNLQSHNKNSESNHKVIH